MGTVYRGRDLVRDEDVAVKVLDYETCEGSDALRRFERETMLTRRLASPNIVTVLGGSVLPCERPYMVMELLHAPTSVTRLFSAAVHVARCVARPARSSAM